MTNSCPPWCTAHSTPSTDAHGSDGIAVPAVLRAPAGVEACDIEVGLVKDDYGSWVWIEATDSSARLVLDAPTFERLALAVSAQAEHLG